jgi:hypothetical protein
VLIPIQTGTASFDHPVKGEIDPIKGAFGPLLGLGGAAPSLPIRRVTDPVLNLCQWQIQVSLKFFAGSEEFPHLLRRCNSPRNSYIGN